MKTKSAQVLGLCIRAKKDGEFYHVNADFVTIGRNQWELQQLDKGEAVRDGITSDTIRNFRWGYECGRDFYLDSLEVNSQGNNTDSERYLYAMELRYKPFAVDLDEAKRMVATLTKISKHMQRSEAKFGRTTTFGQYLARVAAAVGATKMVFTEAGGDAYSSYQHRTHRIEDIADGVRHVDHIVQQWQEENKQVTT